MNFADWYTDSMDIYRNVKTKDGNLTRQTRTLVASGVPCRIYENKGGVPVFKRQASDVTEQLKLACANSVDLRAGDELIIIVGGMLGHCDEVNRAIPGQPHHYYEPFGAVMPQLAHQEVDIVEMERIDEIGKVQAATEKA